MLDITLSYHIQNIIRPAIVQEFFKSWKMPLCEAVHRFSERAPEAAREDFGTDGILHIQKFKIFQDRLLDQRGREKKKVIVAGAVAPKIFVPREIFNCRLGGDVRHAEHKQPAPVQYAVNFAHSVERVFQMRQDAPTGDDLKEIIRPGKWVVAKIGNFKILEQFFIFRFQVIVNVHAVAVAVAGLRQLFLEAAAGSSKIKGFNDGAVFKLRAPPLLEKINAEIKFYDLAFAFIQNIVRLFFVAGAQFFGGVVLHLYNACIPV